MTTKVELDRKVKAKGWEIAEALRADFRKRGIYAVNLIGSPGAGKTSLLEALAPRLQGKAAVIEGDLQTDEDKRRIERCGLPAYEINTIGACHLDAKMVENALTEFPIPDKQFLFIENVGNLVCPASCEIGEDIKIAVISVTEGGDKPAKYPVALRVSAAMVISKLDLLPYVDCDVERMERDALAANPEIEIFKISAKNGDGLDEFLSWLEELRAARN
ncbi:MAG: hydrogenase nickel incorporation protein HypB [Candidatus Omnitrophota bacterium]